MNSIKNRRSIRKYKPDTVSQDMIDDIILAAIFAPSAKNRQPWKFYVYTSDKRKQLTDIIEASLIKEQKRHRLLPKSRKHIPDAFNTVNIMKTAPVIVMVINTNGQSPFRSVHSDARITEICDSLSIGASIENILLRATELGLGTLWIANTCFAYKDLMKFMNVKGQLIGAVLIGYADEEPDARPRKPLSDILEYR